MMHWRSTCSIGWPKPRSTPSESAATSSARRTRAPPTEPPPCMSHKLPSPDIAVVTPQPGSKSQQNVQRQGFDLLYARAGLVKQP
jgi:hypothetical protein